MKDNLEWSRAEYFYSKDPLNGEKDKRIESWSKLLTSLPNVELSSSELKTEVSISLNWTSEQKRVTENLLLDLIPWRKGPFNLGGIDIDTEWRSNLKWERFLSLGLSLEGKKVLDVGAGNGYYAFRMLGERAREVICLEPNLTHVIQFLSINHFLKKEEVKVIPKRLEQLTPEPNFDIIFSMGVLYHQRNPSDHIKLLSSNLKPKGKLVLETILSFEGSEMEIKNGKYANMPNVWYLHDANGIKDIAHQHGLKVSAYTKGHVTSSNEQRKTRWMPFKSFSDAINIKTGKTLEGYSLPKRSFFILEKN